MAEEPLPISEKLKVLQHETLFKSDKWWAAVALLESFGRKQVALYLWTKRGNQWKRKQKYVIRDRTEWNRVKDAVERLIPNL
ncbi:MAG: hypothetical protein QXQ28_06860 [Candidatus Nezhaarchaeales archaeon]